MSIPKPTCWLRNASNTSFQFGFGWSLSRNFFNTSLKQSSGLSWHSDLMESRSLWSRPSSRPKLYHLERTSCTRAWTWFKSLIERCSHRWKFSDGGILKCAFRPACTYISSDGCLVQLNLVISIPSIADAAVDVKVMGTTWSLDNLGFSFGFLGAYISIVVC